MGLFDLLKGTDINQGVEEWKNTKDAVLIDVRTREEYSQAVGVRTIRIHSSEKYWWNQWLKRKS